MNIKQKLSDFVQLEQGSAHLPKMVGVGASILATALLTATAHATGHNDWHQNYANGSTWINNSYNQTYD